MSSLLWSELDPVRWKEKPAAKLFMPPETGADCGHSRVRWPATPHRKHLPVNVPDSEPSVFSLRAPLCPACGLKKPRYVLLRRSCARAFAQV